MAAAAGNAQRQLRRWVQEAGVRKVKKFKKVVNNTFPKWKVLRGDKVSMRCAHTRSP